MLTLGAYELLELLVQLQNFIFGKTTSIVKRRKLFCKDICFIDSYSGPIEELYRLIVVLLKNYCSKSLLLHVLGWVFQ